MFKSLHSRKSETDESIIERIREVNKDMKDAQTMADFYKFIRDDLHAEYARRCRENDHVHEERKGTDV